MITEEQKRLAENKTLPVPKWYKWGPYVAERSWGTVREDYSSNGDAWSYFPFDSAQSKVYRWGEDGIAGWCDRYQVLVFSPAFWNGKDPFLKERLFGLNSQEGNHGEDVKEYYYYLDALPTHSYMKYLYKYPQEGFPYELLKEKNRNRSTHEPEFELVETGIFSQNRYFDIFIEYAKASPEDLCIKIEVFNRGDKAAPLHIIPHLWFRNQWCWGDIRLPEPQITNDSTAQNVCLLADDASLLSPPNLSFDYHLGKRYLYGPKGGKPLFTNNEDHGTDQPYLKKAFHRAIVNNENTVNPKEIGTKACIHYFYESIPAHGSVVLYLRLSDHPLKDPLADVEKIVALRKQEADAFYKAIQPKTASEDEKSIQRQALAGMLWSKQIYLFDVNKWLKGDNTYNPPPPSRNHLRNVHWNHLNSMRILSMPDKWEYPWFAAWDLAFHCITLGLVDIEFAKEQLWLLLFDQFQHPNGAIPAYEWEFSDLNPPVQAWAAYRLFKMNEEQTGIKDFGFLKKCFLKLLINFAWWVNKVDSSGYNVFEGGFLGLDNITIIDRSQVFEGGAILRQSDGTGWMAMFCLNLMRMALSLSEQEPIYEFMATKFFEHFIYIGHAMKKRDNQNYELWSEEDGFFYDVMTYPDGKFAKFRVRSLVGIIPLFAVDIIEEEELNRYPEFKSSFLWFLTNRRELTKDCAIPLGEPGKMKYLLTLVNENRLSRILEYVWNPNEFRSDYGLRSLSKYHEAHPFIYQDKRLTYEPAESIARIKGGNSNWRGPIWMPTNYLLIQSLKKFSDAFKDGFKISLPNEDPVTLDEMATSFSKRLISIFALDKNHKRPFLDPHFPFAKDPHFQNYILFNEYYHGDTGKGLGASHQTGWSGLVANIIQELNQK